MAYGAGGIAGTGLRACHGRLAAMTPAQIVLLKRLIAADRRYHSLIARRMPVSCNERGIEIGVLSGVDPRTARTLEDAGLAESLDPGINGRAFLFLGRYEPVDEVT